MELPLPLDSLRFNIVLWLLISAYWASGIWNFIALVPGCSDEDAEILWYSSKSNYSFWLISSLIFFLLWISQFHYPILITLSIIEIYIIIVAYLYLIIHKRCYLRKNKKKESQIKKRRFDEFTGKAY